MTYQSLIMEFGSIRTHRYQRAVGATTRCDQYHVGTWKLNDL